jgi:hypothetical protein
MKKDIPEIPIDVSLQLRKEVRELKGEIAKARSEITRLNEANFALQRKLNSISLLRQISPIISSILNSKIVSDSTKQNLENLLNKTLIGLGSNFPLHGIREDRD